MAWREGQGLEPESRRPVGSIHAADPRPPKVRHGTEYLEVTVRGSQSPVQIINEGYWGMGLKKGERYHLRTILRLAPGYRGTVVAKMLSASGDVLALAPVACPADGEWHDVKLVLTPSATDGKASLALEFNAPGKAWLDYVSLFPEQTFKQRPNGLRKDVAEMLAGLRPAFFPLARWLRGGRHHLGQPF